jgi:hypothetical protein
MKIASTVQIPWYFQSIRTMHNSTNEMSNCFIAAVLAKALKEATIIGNTIHLLTNVLFSVILLEFSNANMYATYSHLMATENHIICWQSTQQYCVSTVTAHSFYNALVCLKTCSNTYHKTLQRHDRTSLNSTIVAGAIGALSVIDSIVACSKKYLISRFEVQTID